MGKKKTGNLSAREKKAMEKSFQAFIKPLDEGRKQFEALEKKKKEWTKAWKIFVNCMWAADDREAAVKYMHDLLNDRRYVSQGPFYRYSFSDTPGKYRIGDK